MNWKHSLYQIYAITVGQSFTIDEAYRLLNEQREDRLFSISSAFAETYRAKAKVIDAKRSIKEYENTKGFAAQKRRSQAAILETEARFILAQPCLDMARVELAFIEQLIQYIDDNCVRLHSEFAYGSQAVQPFEYAFEYLWSLIYEGPHSELMKNIWVNPFAQQIIDTAGLFANSDLKAKSKDAVATALAQALSIPSESLSITVNIQLQLESAHKLLLTYASAHDSSMLSLQEKADEQLSGDNHASPELAGST